MIALGIDRYIRRRGEVNLEFIVGRPVDSVPYNVFEKSHILVPFADNQESCTTSSRLNMFDIRRRFSLS